MSPEINGLLRSNKKARVKKPVAGKVWQFDILNLRGFHLKIKIKYSLFLSHDENFYILD